MTRVTFNRFKVQPPLPAVKDRYLLDYPSLQIYTQNPDLLPVTSSALFANSKPLLLDLGCGRGEYTLQLAEGYPDTNVIGIDNHTKSLFDAVNRASALSLSNLKFIRADLRFILSLIPANSVAHLTLLFPPPPTKKGLEKRHFFNPDFVMELHRLLKAGGTLLFVSDNPAYFSAKSDLLLGLLKPVSTSRYFLPPQTRFASIWQAKGITPQSILLKKSS